MNYTAVREFFLDQGNRLLQISSEGISKEQLPALEQNIERAFFELLNSEGHSVSLYGEDLEQAIPVTDSYWVIDPISGTNHFAAGSPDYTLCAAEVSNGEIVYAIVAAPAHEEFFEARKGMGVIHNNAPLQFRENIGDLILNLDPLSTRTSVQQHIWQSSSSLYPFVLNQSSALSYCRVAQRRYRRIISVSKDSFPYYAGAFIINESGGKCTNGAGLTAIQPTDNIFVGAIDTELHSQTLELCQ